MEKVQRQLEKYCSHVSAMSLATIKIDDKLIQEHAMEARSMISSNQRLSSTYWNNLIKKFGFDEQPVLVVKDKTETVDKGLASALDLATTKDNHKRSKDSLVTFLSGLTSMNQRESRCCGSIRQTACESNQSC